MGADLIGLAWTRLNITKPDEDEIRAMLADISDEEIMLHLDALDPSGGYFEIASDAREAIHEGAMLAIGAAGYERMSALYDIPGTALTFCFMGGTSGGDDPFESFTSLGVFLNATEIWPRLARETGVLCQGLPDAKTIWSERISHSVPEEDESDGAIPDPADEDPPFTCRACGREELTCSKDPCPEVVAEREEHRKDMEELL